MEAGMAVADLRKRMGLVMGLRALLMLLAGLYAVIWPAQALFILVWAGAILLIVDGALGLWALTSAARRRAITGSTSSATCSPLSQAC
jgi:uncharacterized membrane protein HdeD (DUF308 family)